MPPDYYSLLICAHKDRTCVYVNGLEIGIIANGVFKPTYLNVNGTLIPKTIRNLNVPFHTIEEFKVALANIIADIKIPNEPEEPVKVCDCCGMVKEKNHLTYFTNVVYWTL